MIPFMDRVLYVFLVCVSSIIVLGLLERNRENKSLDLAEIDFSTSSTFLAGGMVIIGALVALYGAFW